MQTGVDDVTDALVSRYAAATDQNSTNQLLLNVTNLSGISDYAHVMSYLNNLTSVQNVQVLNVAPTEANFKLTITGSIAVSATLHLDGH